MFWFTFTQCLFSFCYDSSSIRNCTNVAAKTFNRKEHQVLLSSESVLLKLSSVQLRCFPSKGQSAHLVANSSLMMALNARMETRSFLSFSIWYDCVGREREERRSGMWLRTENNLKSPDECYLPQKSTF